MNVHGNKFWVENLLMQNQCTCGQLPSNDFNVATQMGMWTSLFRKLVFGKHMLVLTNYIVKNCFCHASVLLNEIVSWVYAYAKVFNEITFAAWLKEWVNLVWHIGIRSVNGYGGKFRVRKLVCKRMGRWCAPGFRHWVCHMTVRLNKISSGKIAFVIPLFLQMDISY